MNITNNNKTMSRNNNEVMSQNLLVIQYLATRRLFRKDSRLCKSRHVQDIIAFCKEFFMAEKNDEMFL